MRLKTLTFLFLTAMTLIAHAQSKNFIDVPYLETMATADTLVVPDKIYLNILVSEKDAKGNIPLEHLQVKMEEALKKLGINTNEDLELSDLVSNFRRYFLKGQDIMKTKLYSLVVKDATMSGKVIVALEEVGISNVTLEKVENSKKDEIMLLLKAKAISRSKQYADVMANELNQKIGNAIFISDQSQAGESQSPQGNGSIIRIRGASSIHSEGKDKTPDIQFEKIKFQTSVHVRYKLN